MDKIIFMTGATSGLGKVAAIDAAKNGATVIVLARSLSKGKTLISDFSKSHPDSTGKIEILEGNLSSFKSVVSACQKLKEKYDSLDAIVNNAGIMNFKPIQTEDGIEETLQVNLLSPLLICHLLFELIKKSKDAKIIFTSSGLHQGEINFDNLEFKNNFSSFKVYRQSKLGVILLCRLLAESLKEDNIKIYCLHPGVVRTNLGNSAGWFSKIIFFLMGKSPQKGAETLTYLIDTPASQLTSGEYYSNNKITKTTTQSYDIEVAQKLLVVSQTNLEKYIHTSSPIFQKTT